MHPEGDGRPDKEKNLSRRDFLKKAGLGIAGAGTLLSMPKALALDIHSDKGLDFFDKSSEKRFGVGGNGVLETGQIGTSSNTVNQIFAKELNSESSSPNIVVYEDDSGNAKAVSSDETYTGEDVMDAAQQALNDKLDSDSGNVHIRVKPGLYEIQNGLVVDSGERSKHIQAVKIESPSLYGAYFHTYGLDDEPVIKFDPEGDPVSGDSGDRWRDITLENMFFDNRDEVQVYESSTPDSERDIKGVVLGGGMRINLYNLEFRGYRQALQVTNIFEGKIDNIRVTSSGKASSDDSAIIMEQGDSGFGSAADAINHVEVNNIRGGYGCQKRFFTVSGTVRDLLINYPSMELDCPGFRLEQSETGALPPKVIVSNGSFRGSGPSFRVDAGELIINGGDYSSEAEVIRAGSEGGRTLVSLGDAVIGGSESHDALEIFQSDLHISNVEINHALRGIEVGDASSENWEKSDSDPNPWNIQIDNVSIRNTAEEGIFLNRNFRKYRWMISNCNIIKSCKSGGVSPITVNSRNTDINDVSIDVDSDSSSKPGVTVNGSDVSINNIIAGENLTELIDASGGDVREFGSSSTRPSNVEEGFRYFDSDLGKPVYWDGSDWVDSSGNSV